MKRIVHLLIVVFLSNSVDAQLKKGAIVAIMGSDTTRIGDSAWHYTKGWDYQFDVLTSTKKYPFGIWLPVGKVIKNRCQCNPKEAKLEGFK